MEIGRTLQRGWTLKTLCAKWNRPDIKGQMSFDFPSIRDVECHIRRGSEENAGPRSWERHELRSQCLVGTVSIWEDEKVLEVMVVMVAQCRECS